MRIYLVGFMGAGKTAVGERLASLLAAQFVDLDAAIERRAGMTVREIFARHGEPHFRELESRELCATAATDPVVVATGGGTVGFAANRRFIEHSGVSVWLHPPLATIVGRIGGRGKEDRPLFRDEAHALALYRERLPAYRSADLRIDVAPEEQPQEIAQRIALRLGERARCGT